MTEEEITLEIRGMTCDSCAVHVTRALEGVPGVEQVVVPGWQSGQATLLAGPEVNDAALADAVAAAGGRRVGPLKH